MEFQGDFISWKGIMVSPEVFSLVSPFKKIANFQHLNETYLE